MKLKKIITTAALALVGAALIETSASAQTFNQGDLILGFQTSSGTGSSDNLEVDLGSYITYINAATADNGTVIDLNVGQALGTGGLSVTDLNNTYGSSWSSNGSLTFNVAGTPGTGTKESLVTSTKVGGATENSTGNGSGLITGEYSTGLHITPSPALVSTSAYVLPNNVAGSFTYQVTNNGQATTDYSLGYNTQEGVTGANNTISLYELVNHSGSTTKGTLLGVFDLTSSGGLTFDAIGTAAVPEPSTYALFGLGALALVLMRRRMIKA